MKNSTKILIGLGIAAGVTAVLAIGIIRELKAIRALTIDTDEIPDELDAVEMDEVIIADAE